MMDKQNKFTYIIQGTQDIDRLREHLTEVSKILKQHSFISKAKGLSASINKRTIEKIASNKAVEKSTIGKPYTKEEHFKVAEDIGNLYENSTLQESHADRKKSPNIANVHRFTLDIEVNGKNTISKITMFEKIEGENRLYSIELSPSPENPCVQEIETAKSTQHHTTTHPEVSHIADFGSETISQDSLNQTEVKEQGDNSSNSNKSN